MKKNNIKKVVLVGLAFLAILAAVMFGVNDIKARQEKAQINELINDYIEENYGNEGYTMEYCKDTGRHRLMDLSKVYEVKITHESGDWSWTEEVYVDTNETWADLVK